MWRYLLVPRWKMRRALIRVLRMHAPLDGVVREGPVCRSCSDTDEQTAESIWVLFPCATVRAIRQSVR